MGELNKAIFWCDHMKTKTFAEVWEDLENAVSADQKNVFTYPQKPNQVDPKGYGVYCIYGKSKGEEDAFLYIGKSGTIKPGRKMGDQTLAKRLVTGTAIKADKAKGVKALSRRDFFMALVSNADEKVSELIKEKHPRLNGKVFDSIEIHWIETFKDFSGVPPAVAEVQLMWAYLSEFGDLPKMNKEF